MAATPVGEPPVAVVEGTDLAGEEALNRPGGPRAQARYADARAAQENEPIGPFRQGREANPIASTGPPGATAKALDDGIPSHVRPMLNIGDGTATTDASTAATRDIGGLQDSLNKPQRNFLDRIRTLKGSAKEAVRKQGANLEKALAQKTGVPLEDIQALTKAMDPAGRTLGEGRFPYMIRQLGQKSTRQTAVKLGAASSLTFAQTAQVQAEKESAEAGMKEATKGTKNAVDALNEAMGADFDALGKARGSADAKSQAERERQLRMLEAMARSQNTGGLAAAYQQHRNRAYY